MAGKLLQSQTHCKPPAADALVVAAGADDVWFCLLAAARCAASGSAQGATHWLQRKAPLQAALAVVQETTHVNVKGHNNSLLVVSAAHQCSVWGHSACSWACMCRTQLAVHQQICSVLSKLPTCRRECAALARATVTGQHAALWKCRRSLRPASLLRLSLPQLPKPHPSLGKRLVSSTSLCTSWWQVSLHCLGASAPPQRPRVLFAK